MSATSHGTWSSADGLPTSVPHDVLQSRFARVMLWAALVCAIVTAALLGPFTWDDSGAFVFPAVGIPVLAAAVPLLAQRTRWVRVLSWCAAAVVTAWGLLLALGIGIFLLPTAVLLVAAASSPTRRS